MNRRNFLRLMAVTTIALSSMLTASESVLKPRPAQIKLLWVFRKAKDRTVFSETLYFRGIPIVYKPYLLNHPIYRRAK